MVILEVEGSRVGNPASEPLKKKMMNEYYEGRMIAYDWGDGVLLVYPKCPHCGRFIKAGTVLRKVLNDELSFKNFKCKKCGIIEPEDYYWE